MFDIIKRLKLLKTLLALKLHTIFSKPERKEDMELAWDEPFDYRLSIHFSNYENTYGEGSFAAHLSDYEELKSLEIESKNFVISNLVKYYGIEKLKKFINLVTGNEGK